MRTESKRNPIVKIYSDISAQPSYADPAFPVQRKQATGSGYVVDLVELLMLNPSPLWFSDHDLQTRDQIIDRLKQIPSLSPNTKDQYLVVVTNVHVVYGGTNVSFSLSEHDGRLDCQPLMLCHEFDIAVFVPKRPLEDIDVLTMSLGLPKRGDKVVSLGYPSGVTNDSLAQAGGMVTRVGPIYYTHASLNFLAIETTASVNPGNSGGPLVDSDNEGVVIGTIHQLSRGGNQQAFAVPNVLLYAAVYGYLSRPRLENKCPGIPATYQALVNQTQRAVLGLSDEDGGVLITNVHPFFNTCLGDKKLQVGDVLSSVDGFSVSSKGEVKIGGVKLPWTTLVYIRPLFSSVDLEVRREGQVIAITLELRIPFDELKTVSLTPTMKGPGYFFHSGVFFYELHYRLSSEYTTNNSNKTPPNLYNAIQDRQYAVPLSDDEKLKKREVVVARLYGAAGVGYESLGNDIVVTHINGKYITSLAHTRQILNELEPGQSFSLRALKSGADNIHIKSLSHGENEALAKELRLPQLERLPKREFACRMWSKVREAVESGQFTKRGCTP